MPIDVHIINHTHWDREWFLTSEYTSRWIPNLIKNLERRSSKNQTCHFLLDGQTLVIEDLLKLAPETASVVRSLVKKGCLTIGPYYSQPDWQLASGELLMRNLQYGLQDIQNFDGLMQVGWMVDTFGHISQAPQIHSLFGLKALYLWRGVPQLVPYFIWQGSDGTQLLSINLFGGYRNLYGVTQVPEVGVKRLAAEVKRLAPFYPTNDIPLFDGYDLEDNPEDPLAFYGQTQGINPEFKLHEASPESFASLIVDRKINLPTLEGELNSGKFGATFPGAFSARTYLKIMAHDCQNLLYKYCEPLASLAYLCGQPYPAQRFENLSRLLLQSGVHDCICGVSIDQVHEKMCWHYQNAFTEMLEILQDSLRRIMQNFSPGEYAISTNPFSAECWLPVGGNLLQLQTHGIGIWPIYKKFLIDALTPEPEDVSDFSWSNDFYEAYLQPDGQLRIGNAILGEIRVFRENGDTYSDERGELLGILLPLSNPRIIEKSTLHTVLEFESAWHGRNDWVSTRIRLILDPSPLVRWQIELDSYGADLCIEIRFNTAQQGEIWAGMPFDLVKRPEADADLLPRQLSPQLASILLGQRELGEVRTFPFHDMVGISDQKCSSIVFGRGLHAYRAEKGILSLPLRRSVEWLTRPDLTCRVGDAGPYFYVPDARCERRVHHELAFASLPYPATSMKIQALNASFQNPPLVIRSECQGKQNHWEFLQEDLPLSALQVKENTLLARFCNPTDQIVKLSRSYMETDIWGQENRATTSVKPKKIICIKMPSPKSEIPDLDGERDPQLSFLNPPQWRVGVNHGAPDQAILAKLEQKIAFLDEKIEQIANRLAQMRTEGLKDLNPRLLLEHTQYTLQRERLEYQLSLLLNLQKLKYGGSTPLEILSQVDPEIASIGKELNTLRIKRRIYDYVVQVLD
jgi:alpha-mannosidase